MVSIPEEERPRPKTAEHVIGQDLATLSVEELGLRIEMLKEEIERLEAARRSKSAQLAAAASFFKR
jgi:uncharacterized small protein (DUF1192 family)